MNALRWTLAASAATMLVLASASALAQEVAAPALKVGDTWRFREIDLLTKNETNAYVERVHAASDLEFWLAVESARGKHWWRGDSARAVRLEQRAHAADQPEQRGAAIGSADGGFAMRWPIKVGDRFDCSENATFPNGWKLKYDLKCAVEGAETIELPAGKFETLRITAKGYYTNFTNDGNTGQHERVFWYAPAARTFVRREYRTWLPRGARPFRVEGHELVEFKPAS